MTCQHFLNQILVLRDKRLNEWINEAVQKGLSWSRNKMGKYQSKINLELPTINKGRKVTGREMFISYG